MALLKYCRKMSGKCQGIINNSNNNNNSIMIRMLSTVEGKVFRYFFLKRNFKWPSLQIWQYPIYNVTLESLKVWISYLWFCFFKLFIFICSFSAKVTCAICWNKLQLIWFDYLFLLLLLSSLLLLLLLLLLLSRYECDFNAPSPWMGYEVWQSNF